MRVLRTFLIVLCASVLVVIPVSAQVLNNYIFTSSTSTFTPLTGASIPNIGVGSLDDGTYENIPLGFDFYYMGNRYSTVSMCTNGYITLTNPGIVNPTASGGVTGAPNLSTVAQRPVIAPYWRDMAMDLGTASYQTTGSIGSRVFTAEWLQARIFTSSTVRVPFISFQVKLYEGTGIVEFLYRTENGPLYNPNTPTALVTAIGINGPISGQYFMLNGAASNSNALYNIQTTGLYDRPATNQLYRFTPLQNTVSVPGSLAFSGVTGTAMTLTWQNTATNASGFAIYRSDDGGSTYKYVGYAPLSSPSFTAENLNANKTYFWRVHAISEGVISTALSGSQATATGTRTATSSGNWSLTSTWSGGVVPTATDNVTVPSGITVTIDNTTATSNNLDVSGTVEFAATGNNTLSVMQNLLINSTGIVRTSATGTSTSNTLNIGSNQRIEGGNLTNNGTLDLHNNAGSAAAALVFMGAGNSVFNGTGSTTDVYTITLNKGTGAHLTTMNYALMPVLQLNATTFTVRSSTGNDATGFLTLTNGILRISGSFTYSSNVFTTAAYSINSTSGIWLDNANFTINGQNGTPTCNGYFRVSNGTYNVGTSSGNTMQFASTSTSISGTPAATVI
ncbi:MAG: hypothetical protein JNJ85_10440, partial [Candidatus Kapabacteria bacterium]|nr:hypothetical protein [Candidatus Kapabacteria bacterium]